MSALQPDAGPVPAPPTQPVARGVASSPRGHKQLMQEARACQRGGRLAQAARLYERALQLRPDLHDARFELGHITARIRNLDQGIQMVREAIRLNDRVARYHVGLADLLQAKVEIEESLRSAKRALELEPGNAFAHSVVAASYERMHRYDDALAHARQAAAATPSNAHFDVMVARLTGRLGDLESARDRLESIVRSTSTPPLTLQKGWHELGTVLDRLKRYDDAFEAFTQSARLKAEGAEIRRFDPEELPRRIASYESAATPELMNRWSIEQLQDENRPRLTFLIGFPRSGTTMSEQVLAAHPDITTSDEEQALPHTVIAMRHAVNAADDAGDLLRRLTLEDARRARSMYWGTMEASFGATLRRQVFVDKLPLNIVDLPFINAVFPDARIIVALRDPRDVILSCFMQDFQLNAAMVHFLSIDRAASLYQRIMNIYLSLRDDLTTPSIEIRYEDTVADLEGQARRILTFLELEWRAEVLDFHEKAASRIVRTPSFTAVSERVHTRSVGRWQNYESALKETGARLQRFLEAFGYA